MDYDIIKNLEAVRTGAMYCEAGAGALLLKMKLIEKNQRTTWYDLTDKGREYLTTKEKTMTKDWRNDPATPADLKDVERGTFFQPAYPNGRQTFDVKTGEWEHVARASFGPARFGWSGDSYRYDIYRYAGKSIFDQGAWGLRFSHGGGNGWLTHRPLSGETTPLEHAVALPEPLRWDVCHFLYDCAEKTACEAARDKYRELAEAFVEGRLKKRRKDGRVRVEIITKPIEETSKARNEGEAPF